MKKNCELHGASGIVLLVNLALLIDDKSIIRNFPDSKELPPIMLFHINALIKKNRAHCLL